MSKEITKAIILQEIQDKLRLRDFIPAKFLFDETVVPVYDIGQHLESWWQQYMEKSVTSASGLSFFIVPGTERWHLKRYDIVFMGAGAYTVSGLYVVRTNRVGAASVYLDLTAAQTVSYHVELPQPAVLQSGDILYINIDGYTSPQNLRLYIDYMKEEIR